VFSFNGVHEIAGAKFWVLLVLQKYLPPRLFSGLASITALSVCFALLLMRTGKALYERLWMFMFFVSCLFLEVLKKASPFFVIATKKTNQKKNLVTTNASTRLCRFLTLSGIGPKAKPAFTSNAGPPML